MNGDVRLIRKPRGQNGAAEMGGLERMHAQAVFRQSQRFGGPIASIRPDVQEDQRLADGSRKHVPKEPVLPIAARIVRPLAAGVGI